MNLEYIKDKTVKINEIQEIALNIYGRYDLEKSIIWMMEEFGEVVSAIRKDKPKEDICGELGDLTAWIFCLGNILGINISDAVSETFIKEVARQQRTYGRLKYMTEKEYCKS